MLNTTFTYRPNLARVSGFSGRRQKRTSKKDEAAKNWLQVHVLWLQFLRSQKTPFLNITTPTLVSEVLLHLPVDVFICTCFMKAAELCRVQENSSQIKCIGNSCSYLNCTTSNPFLALTAEPATHLQWLYQEKIIKISYFICSKIKHVLRLLICNDTLIQIKIHKTEPEILILVFLSRVDIIDRFFFSFGF